MNQYEELLFLDNDESKQMQCGNDYYDGDYFFMWICKLNFYLQIYRQSLKFIKLVSLDKNK